jgi:hypothetical protein
MSFEESLDTFYSSHSIVCVALLYYYYYLIYINVKTGCLKINFSKTVLFSHIAKEMKNPFKIFMI